MAPCSLLLQFEAHEFQVQRMQRVACRRLAVARAYLSTKPGKVRNKKYCKKRKGDGRSPFDNVEGYCGVTAFRMCYQRVRSHMRVSQQQLNHGMTQIFNDGQHCRPQFVAQRGVCTRLPLSSDLIDGIIGVVRFLDAPRHFVTDLKQMANMRHSCSVQR